MCNETVASVHRFRDMVAISIGTGDTIYPNPKDGSMGETIYLRPEEAAALASALNACTRDIKKSSFVNSEFKTTDIKRGVR